MASAANKFADSGFLIDIFLAGGQKALDARSEVAPKASSCTSAGCFNAVLSGGDMADVANFLFNASSEEESFCKTAADELTAFRSREQDMEERPIYAPDRAWADVTANTSSMMSDTVWISIAMGDGTNVRRL